MYRVYTVLYLLGIRWISLIGRNWHDSDSDDDDGASNEGLLGEPLELLGGVLSRS